VRWGSIAVILTLLVVTVTVLANAVFSTLARRYSWYADMNGEENYDVTEDCYALLGNFFASLSSRGYAPKAEIIFCTVEEEIAKEHTQQNLYHAATSLAKRFPEQITVTCHDIWTNPNSVRDYATTFDPETGNLFRTYAAVIAENAMMAVALYKKVEENKLALADFKIVKKAVDITSDGISGASAQGLVYFNDSITLPADLDASYIAKAYIWRSAGLETVAVTEIGY